MIISSKQSIPYVVKSDRAEVSINGKWLKKKIDECILNLKEAGFKVRAVFRPYDTGGAWGGYSPPLFRQAIFFLHRILKEEK